jgi:hypothetical protein
VKVLFLLLLSVGAYCTAQVPIQPGNSTTSGSCSPAVSGSHNTFTITCQNLPKNLQTQIQDLLNKLVKDQADAQAVLSKLDTCLEEVRAVREAQMPWRLTDVQKAAIKGALSSAPIGDAKITVNVIPQDRNAALVANDLVETLRQVGWLKDTDGVNSDFTLNPQIVGIILVVKNGTLAQAGTLQHALNEAGLNVSGMLDEKGSKATDEKSIYIAIGAKPPSTSPTK